MVFYWLCLLALVGGLEPWFLVDICRWIDDDGLLLMVVSGLFD